MHEQSPRLKELLLHYNQIGEEGCKTLAAALEQGAAPSLKARTCPPSSHAPPTNTEPPLASAQKLELLSKQPELVAVCEERGIRLLF